MKNNQQKHIFFFVRLKTKRQKLPITKIEQDSVKKSEAN